MSAGGSIGSKLFLFGTLCEPCTMKEVRGMKTFRMRTFLIEDAHEPPSRHSTPPRPQTYPNPYMPSAYFRGRPLYNPHPNLQSLNRGLYRHTAYVYGVYAHKTLYKAYIKRELNPEPPNPAPQHHTPEPPSALTRKPATLFFHPSAPTHNTLKSSPRCHRPKTKFMNPKPLISKPPNS